MADIDIEKKGPGVLPWIIGIILLAAVVWALAALFGGDDEVEEQTGAMADPAVVAGAPATPVDAEVGTAAPAAVQQYIATCASTEASAMSLDHQQTSSCIERLVASIDALRQSPDLSGVDAQAQLQDAQQAAQRLTQTTESTQHAGMTRDAMLSAAAVLNAMQDARFPALDAQVSRLEETAREVQPGAVLLEQRDVVQRYFQEAAEVLNGMAVATPAGA